MYQLFLSWAGIVLAGEASGFLLSVFVLGVASFDPSSFDSFADSYDGGDDESSHQHRDVISCLIRYKAQAFYSNIIIIQCTMYCIIFKPDCIS